MKFDITTIATNAKEKIIEWLEAFGSLIPNMILSLIILVAFLLLARLGRSLFRKVFTKRSANVALNRLFAKIIYYSIFALGGFIVLSVLHLDKAVASLLAGAGVVGIALGFAFQDIAANFVSGVILAFRSPFLIGDSVKINDIEGVVDRTDFRTTVIRTFQGPEVHIPNKDVLQNPIKNYDVTGKRRIDLAVSVAYDSDLERVQQLVVETIKSLDGIIDPDKVLFNFGEFGASSINLKVRFWIKFPNGPSYLGMVNKAIIAIKRAFDEQGITIPFPTRTLEFSAAGEDLKARLS